MKDAGNEINEQSHISRENNNTHTKSVESYTPLSLRRRQVVFL